MTVRTNDLTSLMDSNASCFCYEKPDSASVLGLVPPTERAEIAERRRSAPPLRCLGATTVADRECRIPKPPVSTL